MSSIIAEHKTVKIIHHSTPSLIEIIVTSQEEETQGGKLIDKEEKIMLDYTQFEHLMSAVLKVEQW